MMVYWLTSRYFVQLVSAVLLCSLSAVLAAQEKEPVYECPAQPTVQQGIKAKAPARLEKPSLKTRNAEHLISANDVRRKERDGTAMALVDVRKEEAFALVRIPGSLNIPLYALPGKSFLKSRHVVLVDTGAAYDALAMAASRFKADGFKTVSILDGGLNDWRRAGGAVVGEPLAQQRLLALTPQQYFAERDYDHWLMVDISSGKNSEKTNVDTKLFPDTIKVPYHKDEQRFLSALKSTLDKRKAKNRNNDKTFLVLLDPAGKNAPRLAALVNDLDNTLVFYLDGGLKAYSAFYQSQMTLMLAKGNPGPKRRCEL